MKHLSWNPPVELDKLELKIVKRLNRTGKLFVFLRQHRHALFDDAFQAELATMYSDIPRGAPVAPAFLAMVTLVQAYVQRSDAGAVEDAVFDARWRMVLGLNDAGKPGFSQGVLVDFRRRLVEHDMDRKLVERTIGLAKETGAFGAAKLRVALDSAPLWGAGRVEDTFNLVAHATRLVISCAAAVIECKPEDVRKQAGLTLFAGHSVKAALDIDWADKAQQTAALNKLLGEVSTLRAWLDDNIKEDPQPTKLVEALATLEQVIEQDIEPDPEGGGSRITRGTSANRRISITDPDMRHGRKSSSRVINGYKRHVAVDMTTGLVLATAVRPANEREHVAMDEDLKPDIERIGETDELHIDRGYLAGSWVRELDAAKKRVVSKHWVRSLGGRFSKNDFKIDVPGGVVTCPAGRTANIRGGNTAQFSRSNCSSCSLRIRCTKAEYRSVQIHKDEALLQRFKQELQTPEGRQERRERVVVEHVLAHVTRRQGRRARYLGQRKNLFDLRRTVVIENLAVMQRQFAA